MTSELQNVEGEPRASEGVPPSSPASAPAAAPIKESVMRTAKKGRRKAGKIRVRVRAASPAKAKGKGKAAKTEKHVRSGSKLEKILRLLRRPGGCTAAEVLKATGWPSVSMPQQARAAGVPLKKAKEGGVTRYWIEAEAA